MSGYTLDGKPVDDTLPDNWGRPQSRVGRVGQWGSSSPSGSGRNSPAGRSRLGTMNQLGRDASPEDDEPKRDGTELYAGGERSGLAVQNPGEASNRSVVEDILRQARSSGPPSRASPAPPGARDTWSGVGHTLGSDTVPSVSVGADPNVEPEPEEVQRRSLTFWRDGFSIEDGELYRYDAPGNRELLAAIQAGRAPMSLFNVRFDQLLELVVQQRTSEDYRPPPKKPAVPFSGGGNRLGSLVPNIDAAAAALGGQAKVAAGPSTPAPAAPSLTVDPAKPTTSVQIRLADGKRLVAKVNLDHTVGDLRAFVLSSNPTDRPFVLQTTFPSRELADSETIEAAKLANSVVVQRFK